MRVMLLIIILYCTHSMIYCSYVLQATEQHRNVHLFNEANEFSNPIIISLGFNCTVALMLKNNNLRYLSLPFDWLRSSFSGLCKVIENDFVDFLNPIYLSPCRTYVLNMLYGIGFYHDFPKERNSFGEDILTINCMDNLSEVVIKYQRRIDRFYRAMNSGLKIYFFRTSSQHWELDYAYQDKQSVEKLKNILMKKFPQADFELIVIDPSEEYRDDWGIDRIKNFCLKDSASEQEWRIIFDALGLVRNQIG